MKVLHVIATLDHGGTEALCRDLAECMREKFGVVNSLIAIRRRSGSIELELTRAAHCDIHVAPPAWSGRLRLWFWLFWIIRKISPDAILCHLFGIDHVLVATSAHAAGVKVITVTVGNAAPDACGQKGLRRKWALILALSRALKISVTSASGYIERSMRTLGNMPVQSRVITNGCRTEEIFTRACDSRSKRCPGGPVSIGMVSRLDPIKDHKTLICAFAKLTEMVEINVALKIIGEGVTRGECMRLCEELRIVDKVIFLRNRSDIPEQLGTLDIFAFATTRDEGFGIVLIEALAAGVPIVASDVGACREVLEDGNLGILVPEKNADALCEQLASLVRRVPIPIDRAVLARVRELYDISSTARHHIELFEELRSSVSKL